LVKPPLELCIRCKGARNLCGLGYCPLLAGLRAKVISLQSIRGLDVQGSTPPSIIVGERGYPRIRLYYAVPPGIVGDEARDYDNPSQWHMRKNLGEIIELRSRLLHIVLPTRVYNPYKLYETEIGLAIVSEKPVDTEALLKKKPIPRLVFDPLTPPRGPSAPARRVKVTGNPVIPKPIEKLIWDDIKAEEAIYRLYKNGLDFYTIVRALTIGFLGRTGQRRLVPTRWGITAVDQMISKKLLSKIRKYEPINDLLIFYSEYLYNKYMIILAPSGYRGLWIEVWQPRSLWNPYVEPAVLTVYDNYRGEPNIMDGGYLAARTSVLEYLDRIKRQARIIILREILPQYMFPVGNWQIRLTIKKALDKGPIMKNPSIHEVKDFIDKRFTRIPDKITELILSFTYMFNQKILDKWFKA